MNPSHIWQHVNASLQAWWLARRETRLINAINREMLNSFRNISAAHPALADREVFNKLVMQRNCCDECAAYEIMRVAEESYAVWPLERELTLCDVIHYLAVREFHARQGDEFGMGRHIANSVKAVVPSKLCRVRLKQPYLAERRKFSREIAGY